MGKFKVGVNCEQARHVLLSFALALNGSMSTSFEKLQSQIIVIAIPERLSQLTRSDVFGIVAGTAVTYYLAQTFLLDPLSKFPGPFGAKLSRLYETKVRASGREYSIVESVHQKYGSVVRIGN